MITETWKNGVLVETTATAAVVPQAVSMAQARAALIYAGLIAQVDAAIQAMPGMEGDLARNDWEFRQTVERSSPLVSSLSAALGLTEAQLDTLFSQAAAM